jgi:hypothetical protein
MLVPNPSRVTTDVLEPIDVRALTAHIADHDARIEAAHALVHGALARAVATMSHARPLRSPSRRPVMRLDTGGSLRSDEHVVDVDDR